MRRRATLGRQLLRTSLAALDRERTTCGDCGRTPLAGERVHVYPDETVACALCRPRRAQAPVRVELVRHSEHERTVRRAA